jgi:predicted nucleotidyltransferase
MTKATETLILSALASHPEIRTAILFGSLATGQGHYDSDIDLAIDTGQPLETNAKMTLMAELAECTGRPVDLVDLQIIGEPLLGQVLKHGKRLRGEDNLYAELIMRHVFAEADFMPYYRRILNERRSEWIAK